MYRTIITKSQRTLLNNLIAGNKTTRLFCSNNVDYTNRVVMSFGDGSHGALGLPASLTGHGADVYEPTPVCGLPHDVSMVTAGHYHSLAVTSQGHLWAWGRNHEGQLGRTVIGSRDEWSVPKIVEGLEQVKVTGAFASGVVSAAIGEDGSLWVWGKSKRGQLGLGNGVTEALVLSKVEALAGLKIAKVSFGWGHALAQTEDGKLFGWGYSADGRLGRISGDVQASMLDSSVDVVTVDRQQDARIAVEAAQRVVLKGMEEEKDMPIVWDPCLVEEVNDAQVSDIACGLDHSLVLLSKCCYLHLCACGNLELKLTLLNIRKWNSIELWEQFYGQLGRAIGDVGLLPVYINFHPLSIASGLGHSLAISRVESPDAIGDATTIVSWGWNHSSQLGRSGPENTPLEVEGLRELNPKLVSGGRVHTIALTSNGEVWVWGCGRNGRLGLGSSYDEAEPMILDSLEGYEVVQAASGFDHNLLLVAQA